MVGAIAKKLEAAGKQCVLISGDKDYYQLVTTQTSLWRIIPSTAKKYEKVYGINFDEYTTAHNLHVGIFETKYGDVDVYGLNVNPAGLENVIDRYAMDSLRVLMK